MPVNKYFNNAPKGYTQEQFLVEDLIGETIKINGMDVYYIVREQEEGGFQDLVYGEDPTAKFTRSYKIEAYFNNVMGNISGGDFLSKFGLQLNDNSSILISRRSFNKIVPANIASRPREGDLVYVPMQTNLYEIKFVDDQTNYYTLGRDVKLPYVFELKLEMFKFSNENIDTGVPGIDAAESESAIALELSLDINGTGNYNIGETVFQGSDIGSSTVSAKILDWYPDTKIIRLYNVKGLISNTQNIIGSTSNTSYSIKQYDRVQNPVNFDLYENETYETDNSFIVTTEKDYLGTI